MITDFSAAALSEAIHARDVSCREVMAAYLDRIDEQNPAVNAIVSLRDGDRLMAEAHACDEELAHDLSRGWMHGMPQAIKDLADTRGLPTTSGSRLTEHFVPRHDCLMVARMKAAGCIVVGKTNVPEFGKGSHTFNDVFGTTRNPFDLARSAGGSSGGAAVALATRMLPVADGSDYMGSLRNPAAWNNIFGFRPSQGRVPAWPVSDGYLAQMGTEGPMGRTVLDVALLLGTQAGFDPRVPLALSGRLDEFATVARARHMSVTTGIAPLITNPSKRELVKPEVLWEVDSGLALSATQVAQAAITRTTFHTAMVALFDRFDVLAIPTAQVWPFPAHERWPQHIGNREMDTYHRWMECTLYATFAGLPAVSVPVGFDERGLPMGMQLIGRPRGDADVLRLAAAYETTLTFTGVGVPGTTGSAR